MSICYSTTDAGGLTSGACCRARCAFGGTRGRIAVGPQLIMDHSKTSTKPIGTITPQTIPMRRVRSDIVSPVVVHERGCRKSP